MSLTLSRHPSLSLIALGRSSRLHLMSAQSTWKHVLASRSTVACRWEMKEHCSCLHPYLYSSTTHILSKYTCMFYEMEGKWSCNRFLVGCCFQNFFKSEDSILFSSNVAFSQWVPFASRWCNGIVVMTALFLESNPVFFYQWDQIFIWLTTFQLPCMPLLCVCWHHFQ